MAESTFQHRLQVTPEKPGVYLMKDAGDHVLYVGKASVLRNRLRSYFGSPSGHSAKIRRLVPQITDFECIVTDTEAEALILENTLIKRYRPRYNARLKDDKTYPFLKIDLSEEYPRVYITRQVSDDGARYFGPFATAGSVRQTMDLVKKLFPYRSCTKVITGSDPRPCLEYFIHRCVAPCSGYASREEYDRVIQQVIMFMEGNTEAVTQELSKKMGESSEGLEFERAAVLRDQIRSIERVAEEQRLAAAEPFSQTPVASKGTHAGCDQVANTSQTRKRGRFRTKRGSEQGHFYQSACHNGRLGVVAIFAPIADSGCNRDYIFECPGQFDTDDVQIRIDSEAVCTEELLCFTGEIKFPAGSHDTGRQTTGDFFRMAGASQCHDGPRSQHVSNDFAGTIESLSLDPLDHTDDRRFPFEVRFQGGQRLSDKFGGNRNDQKIGIFHRCIDV